ncbi:MAG: carboxypeptidase-like regulatory domain-containing protein [Bryobacteraceae bacterium]
MLRMLAALSLATAGFAGQALYNLEGQVRPAGPASITLFGAVTPFDESAYTVDGRFHFHKLLPGTYSVVVFSPERGEARRTVEVGPGTADSRRRVSAQLDFAPGDFTLAGPLRRQDTVARPS